MKTRKLSLRSEALVDLGTDDMAKVAGGTHATCNCPVTHQTIDEPCYIPVSNPVTACVTGWVCDLFETPRTTSIPC